MVRTYEPHEKYDGVTPWPYNIQWAGGRSNWFDNVNYSDISMNAPLPQDILDHLDQVLFVVDPAEPPQLWRSSSYDAYDGSSWHKSDTSSIVPLTTMSRADAINQGNQIYTVYMNVTAGATTGAVNLPTLFPDVQIIRDSVQSYPPVLLTNYTLETDPYGTVLFKPLIGASANDTILISYDITFREQDLDAVEANALPGDQASLSIQNTWGSLAGVTLTQRVLDNISQFESIGSNAYEKAMAVAMYFKSTFRLIMDPTNRPPDGQEVTDWFLEQGGGLPMDFSTAYCVFMRQLGIPARLVTGYALGDSQDGQRIVRIRHMMFWAEVYVPLSTGGGEWIQVVPIGLPSNMGGGVIPKNGNVANITLLVGPPTWALIGNSFNVSAALFVEGYPVLTPENISFRDLTDNVFMGMVPINTSMTPIPLATIEYTFPLNASVGIHIIAATWLGPDITVTNYTTVNAVGHASPMDDSLGDPNLKDPQGPDFIISETFDVDLALGWDNYTAYWTDHLRIHGVMTVGGNPVNGSELNNKYVQILWDGNFIGNATIQDDGYYELLYYLDPTDPLVTTGMHEVWASYAGEYDENGLPVILPGESADHSTVDVFGTVGFTLNVAPTDTFAGDTLVYTGTASLLNGTPLPSGETINIVLGNTIVNTTITDASGNFQGSYKIPYDTANGTYYASVNWTTTLNHISSNSSGPIVVCIRSGSTTLNMTSSVPSGGSIHVNETIVVSGNLVISANGSGLEGKVITLYWDTGSGAAAVASNITNASGNYTISYRVPTNYVGPVTYWTEFGPGDPIWRPSHSNNLTLSVVRWDVGLTLTVTPNPVIRGSNITISGTLSVPDNGSVLADQPVTIWWSNSTHLLNLSAVHTSGTGDYSFEYSITINHRVEIVSVWAQFISSSELYNDGTSPIFSLNVTVYKATITSFSNSTYYHLNETAYIWGQLTYDGGIPLAGKTITLVWDGGTPTTYFLTTNSSGWFNFYYNFSLASDSPAIVNITMSFTSLNKTISNATQLMSITAQLYQLTLSADVAANEVHLDEVIKFSGTLIFNEGTKPASGETLTIYYSNSTHLLSYTKITNSSGGFYFQYNLTMADHIGAVYIWAEYIRSNPLYDNATSANRTVNLILYSFILTLSPNATTYHLDEVAYFQGRLTFEHNGTALSGKEIMIHWDNGVESVYGPYYTNGTGWFDFYYNCSWQQDDPGPVRVWATFNNTNRLWDNATSSDVNINLVRYSFTLGCVTDKSSYYIDQTVYVYGQLLYQVNGSPLVNQPINIIWDWNNGTQKIYGGYLTNSSGYYNFSYSLSPYKDVPSTVTISAQFLNTNPLWNNATSPTTDITIDLYSSTLTITITPTTQYLNETILITGSLLLQHNSSGIKNVQVNIWWDFGNSTIINIGPVQTNSTGQFVLLYSGMDYDKVLSVNVYADWAGNASIYSDTSSTHAVTLQRWGTTFSLFQLTTGDTYHPTETLLINATLIYVAGPPLINTRVDVYLDTQLIGFNSTGSNGEFLFRWKIPEAVQLGGHVIQLRFTSWANWISNVSTAPHSISIDAYSLGWTLTVDPLPTAYLDGRLNISGYLTLSNGSPYVGATVVLMWDHSDDSDGWINITSVTTDSSGWYQFDFALPDDTPVGSASVRAYCAPDKSYITASYSSAVSVDIERVPTLLLATVSVSGTLYRGDTITVYGNLTFETNGSAMVGYDVSLYLGTDAVDTLTITDAIHGSFTFTYDIPIDYPVGPVGVVVRFNPAQPSAVDYASSPDHSVTVYDRITLNLNSLSVSTVLRGDSLQVSGTATNDHGYGGNIPVSVTLGSLTEHATTASSGSFSVTFNIPGDFVLGEYSISVTIDSSDPQGAYYELKNTPNTLSITVRAKTSLEVTLVDTTDIMPGESFYIRVRLMDDSDVDILPQSIALYLNASLLGTFTIDSTDPYLVILPTTWTTRGHFYVAATFQATGYYEGSSADTGDITIHVFTDAHLVSLTPSIVPPGTPFSVTGRLYDSSDPATRIPIADRLLRINLNGTNIIEVYTDSTGLFEYTISPVPREEGTFTYQVTLVSSSGDIVLDPVKITISQSGGLQMQLGDLLPFIALAGAIAIVLFYLYFVKGMFQGTSSAPSIDFATKLRNIQKLRDAGKYSAAITLAYRTFEQLCGIKVGAERMHSETAREFLERVSKVLPINLDTVETFVQIYEEARFSDHEITRDKFDLAIKIFTDIYPRIEESTPLASVT